MVFTRTTTIQGDHLQQIAQRVYGDPTITYPLVKYNPSVRFTGYMDANIELVVPVIEPVTAVFANLPPWKA